MPKKVKFRTRKFLNKPGFQTVAYIYAEITEDHIEFKLGDCDRQIGLEFNSWGRDGRKNSIHKANLLVQEVTKFRDALVEHFSEDYHEE